MFFFFFSSRRRHTRLQGDWSSDVCSSDLEEGENEASLKRIRVPIGLDIGAKSAPEIALAVMAEIQAARGGGTGQPMSSKLRSQAAPVSGHPRSEPDVRSQAAPVSGHPRSEPGSRTPLQ